jgi:hypothetical protein
MPNKRDLILDSYEISKNAYRELCYFCLQYPEKKQKLNNLYNPLHAMNYDGMPHGNSVGEPTAIAGERAAILSRDCEMIERAAKEADHEIAEFILLAVTQDVPYHYLKLLKSLPYGRDKFNEKRRKFYYLLAKSREII